MAVKISAIVCTRNRAARLERALESLARQTLPPSDYEVLVVDNGSTDGTKALVTACRWGRANVRYCYEAEVGVSAARNRSIAEACAPIIAFMDDDAEADDGWLEALCAAFERESTRPLSVGGRVAPAWEAEKPAWLPDDFIRYLSVLDYGQEALALDYPRRYLVGCNLAFERSFLAESGGFDTRMGPRDKSHVTGDEFVPLMDVRQAGGLILYDPAAVVRHSIPTERLTLRWFLRRTYGQGIDDVLKARLLAGKYRDAGIQVRSNAPLRRRLRSHRSRLRTAGAPMMRRRAFIAMTIASYEAGRAVANLGLQRR
jgi:glycosyltransferase involved in cell wall biosynthesis